MVNTCIQKKKIWHFLCHHCDNWKAVLPFQVQINLQEGSHVSWPKGFYCEPSKHILWTEEMALIESQIVDHGTCRGGIPPDFCANKVMPSPTKQTLQQCSHHYTASSQCGFCRKNKMAWVDFCQNCYLRSTDNDRLFKGLLKPKKKKNTRWQGWTIQCDQ